MNLIDSFLFSCTTENNQDAAFISKLIIERATGHTIDKVIIESEKEFRGLNTDERGIRMDICVTEMNESKVARVYDIEPNKYEQKDIFKRSRYYQSLTDAKNLLTGDKFDSLPDFISIWILTYDPFGDNRMIYKVKNMVEDGPGICYNDGTVKLYLYTGGEKGGSKELKELLHLFEDTRKCNATDEDLIKLLNIVNKVKHNEEVGERFMRFESDWDIERRLLREETRKEARAEGLAEGHAEGELKGRIEGIISSYRKFNATTEQIISALMEECNLSENEARSKLAGN